MINALKYRRIMMLTELLVFIGAPIFLLVFVVRLIYGFYKDYTENQEFEEYLKVKYHGL